MGFNARDAGFSPGRDTRGYWSKRALTLGVQFTGRWCTDPVRERHVTAAVEVGDQVLTEDPQPGYWPSAHDACRTTDPVTANSPLAGVRTGPERGASCRCPFEGFPPAAVLLIPAHGVLEALAEWYPRVVSHAPQQRIIQ